MNKSKIKKKKNLKSIKFNKSDILKQGSWSKFNNYHKNSMLKQHYSLSEVKKH